ncbi:trypsin-like peptidase domain-containing protein [Anaeromyxobacter paludicola]|uniref:Serine protease n=1 Tax=Anaeromyxobacter paludicola TaxID=2918171 RepID=A0ABN6NB63_9BACT|nr:trypsin-like peptidase domain-containing protein [Anaeromyxobacter paludicola]BDG10460.1 serine protease [Anaeromyxobacter paludicola]
MTALAQLSRDLADLVARASPSVVGVEHRRGQGSGLVLTPDGYLLTNAHVVRGAEPHAHGRRGHEPLQVRLPGGAAAPATLVGADARTDLAVLRADAPALTPLALAEARRLEVGELVVSIGNPLGFERSVSTGVVSALYRDLPAAEGGLLQGLVQTDAAVNPGNSGGPLLDATGTVVGITTAMLPWARGIGFAVPAHTASWVAAVLLRDGEVRRPVLGVAARSEELSPEAARRCGQPRAVRLVAVEAGSPAERAGLREGDLLLAAAGAPLFTLDDLARAMVLAGGEGRTGEVPLAALRGAERLAVAVHPRPPLREAA